MRRRWIGALLGAAALAVTVQNVVFFRSRMPAAPDAGEPLDAVGDETEPDAPPELDPVGYEQALAYLASLPTGEIPRSPFLTLDEAVALAGGAKAGRDGAALPRLAGTLWSRARRVAWLDGVPHSEGDRIADFELERIDAGSVLLRRGEQSLRVATDRGGAPGRTTGAEAVDAE
ncbi:MAG: hypothetical protein ACQGVC_08975 [Myxococcota bacterium]